MVIFAGIHVWSSVILWYVYVGSQGSLVLREGTLTWAHESILLVRVGGGEPFRFFFNQSVLFIKPADMHWVSKEHCFNCNWESVRYRLGATFLSCSHLTWMCGRRLERRCPCSSRSSCSSFGLAGKQASGREYTLSLQELGLCLGLRSSCSDPFMLSWVLQPHSDHPGQTPEPAIVGIPRAQQRSSVNYSNKCK